MIYVHNLDVSEYRKCAVTDEVVVEGSWTERMGRLEKMDIVMIWIPLICSPSK